MNWLPVLTGPLRVLLGVGVGYLETNGIVTHDQGQQISGAVAALVLVGWSAWQNWRSRQHVEHAAATGEVKSPAI